MLNPTKASSRVCLAKSCSSDDQNIFFNGNRYLQYSLGTNLLFSSHILLYTSCTFNTLVEFDKIIKCLNDIFRVITNPTESNANWKDC